MQRRELIQLIAAVTGCAFVGHDALWAAGDPRPLPYSDSDVDFFDDVADAILPTTDTPGRGTRRSVGSLPGIRPPAIHRAHCTVEIRNVGHRLADAGPARQGFRQADTAAKFRC